jgi:TRAP-type C4-dicarboxylate transport system substrate-binding protein
MQKEYSMVKPLLLCTTAPYQLLTTDKQVKVLADLKGLKIRALGGGQTDVMAALGANPMLVPFPDVYMDMQKGVLDGTIAPLGACEIFNFHEVANYLTYIPISYAPITIQMSLQKFNSLPTDIQDAIMSECGYQGSKWYGKYYSDDLDVAALVEMDEYAKQTGHKVTEYHLPKDELAKWQEVGAKPIWDAWVKSMADKGLPGQAVLDDVLKMIETEPSE